jgi:hypothetical protein
MRPWCKQHGINHNHVSRRFQNSGNSVVYSNMAYSKAHLLKAARADALAASFPIRERIPCGQIQSAVLLT